MTSEPWCVAVSALVRNGVVASHGISWRLHSEHPSATTFTFRRGRVRPHHAGALDSIELTIRSPSAAFQPRFNNPKTSQVHNGTNPKPLYHLTGNQCASLMMFDAGWWAMVGSSEDERNTVNKLHRWQKILATCVKADPCNYGGATFQNL